MVGVVLVMPLGEMRVRPLDLNEALAADGLITTPCVIQIRGVGQEADRAFRRVLIQEYFKGLPIHKWVVREVDLSRHDLGCGPVPRVTPQDCSKCLTTRLER